MCSPLTDSERLNVLHPSQTVGLNVCTPLSDSGAERGVTHSASQTVRGECVHPSLSERDVTHSTPLAECVTPISDSGV